MSSIHMCVSVCVDVRLCMPILFQSMSLCGDRHNFGSLPDQGPVAVFGVAMPGKRSLTDSELREQHVVLIIEHLLRKEWMSRHDEYRRIRNMRCKWYGEEVARRLSPDVLLEGRATSIPAPDIIALPLQVPEMPSHRRSVQTCLTKYFRLMN